METQRCLPKKAWTNRLDQKQVSEREFELTKKGVDSLCKSWRTYKHLPVLWDNPVNMNLGYL